MDVLASIGLGFGSALEPHNLFACFVGVLMGTLVGILPGLGPAATIAILIPITVGMDATTAMIMLAGVYYGAKYGGALTAILINTPGESSSVMTCVDGHKLAMKGRAGVALGIAAISSFIGGTAGVVGLMLIAPALAEFAISFGPPEYFALMLLGLATVIFMSEQSITKALTSCVFGLLLGTVGLDPLYGQQRLTFGEVRLLDGIDFVIVAMGLFAISEVVANVEGAGFVSAAKARFRDLFPSIADVRRCGWTFVRCTGLGFVVGVLPGAGSAVSSFLAYSMEKGIARGRKNFGEGAIEGVAAPETADNAAAVGAMVPLFTLGIPGSGSTAILLGAMMMYGVRPGPLIFDQQPEFIWGIIASMYIGNIMLLILNIPLIPVFAMLLRLNYSYLYPIILVICGIGSYSLRGQFFDVFLMLGFGLIGYIMRKFLYPVTPVLLGLVLGPLIERAYSQSLSMSQGDLSIFVSSPMAAILLLVAAGLLAAGVVMHMRRPRETKYQ